MVLKDCTAYLSPFTVLFCSGGNKTAGSRGQGSLLVEISIGKKKKTHQHPTLSVAHA